jgi:membrane-associated phospholipid phosphatase
MQWGLVSLNESPMITSNRFIPVLAAGLLTIAAAAAAPVQAADIAGLALRSEGWLVKSPAAIAVDPAPKNLQGETDALKAAVARRSSEDVAQFKWWQAGGPVYRWNEIAIEEIQEAFVTLPLATRHLALFHAALDDAIAMSQRQRPAGYRARPQTVDAALSGKASAATLAPSDHAAVAAAAADVLGYLFPARAAALAERAEAAIRSRIAAGVDYPYEAAAGRAIGKQVAALAIARGKSDRADAKWEGTVPEAAGLWKSANPPIAPAAASWQPWLLAHPSELRPAAPPAVGSERFRTDMAEVKNFQRTPKTNHRATYWEVFGGARAHSLWNEITRVKLMEYGVAPETGARILAAMNIAFADAGVACWDAKYAYWYPRPAQVDPDFKSVFPAPNHPSYPSAHSCFGSAAATVLAQVFPQDAARLHATAREASEARIWAGIHYRFDLEAGQEIGRKVGEKALARSFAARGN